MMFQPIKFISCTIVITFRLTLFEGVLRLKYFIECENEYRNVEEN